MTYFSLEISWKDLFYSWNLLKWPRIFIKEFEQFEGSGGDETEEEEEFDEDDPAPGRFSLDPDPEPFWPSWILVRQNLSSLFQSTS